MTRSACNISVLKCCVALAALLLFNGFVHRIRFCVFGKVFFFHNHLEMSTVSSLHPRLLLKKKFKSVFLCIVSVSWFCALVYLCFCVCRDVRMSSHWQSSAEPASSLAGATARENSRIEPAPSAAVRLSEKWSWKPSEGSPKHLWVVWWLPCGHHQKYRHIVIEVQSRINKIYVDRFFSA